MNQQAIEELQQAICRKYGAEYYPAPPGLKVGVALNVRDGVLPINGLRHPAQGDTTGWYVWVGEELSDAPDFFKPLHVEHLDEVCPQIKKYLGLAPGWRFLIASDYEDVWFDENLMKV